MTTINYDKPVADYISRLSATGHVTHSSHKKTSVTIHHNAGILSHDQILNVWKTRPASAHFDVDIHGSVAQYVKVDEYAWAVGNTAGNNSSISIEMSNSHGSPSWTVADATWQNAARLAGWLFYHEIDARPSSSNLFPHKHWSATGCPGPYVSSIWSKILKAAQEAYDSFHGGKAPSGGGSSSAPSKGSSKSIAELAKEVIAGEWGNNPSRAQKLAAAGYNASAVQAEVNRQLSGKHSSTSSSSSSKSVSQVAKDVIAGKYGNGADRERRLKAAGYNASAVQTEVNRELGVGTSAPSKKSVSTMATEVIAGKWGNNPERAKKLRAAGYDAAVIQREVNRRLS